MDDELQSSMPKWPAGEVELIRFWADPQLFRQDGLVGQSDIASNLRIVQNTGISYGVIPL